MNTVPGTLFLPHHRSPVKQFVSQQKAVLEDIKKITSHFGTIVSFTIRC